MNTIRLLSHKLTPHQLSEYLKPRSHGFTIVELLIVVVIIGVLAAIVIVAYNGITVRAQNNSRATEMIAWQKLFEAYRALNGQLPNFPTGEYCLGTGFPSHSAGGNIPRCRSIATTDDTYSNIESDGAFIITELSTVGRIPNSQKIAVTNVVGPYMNFTSGWGLIITGIFKGDAAGDCPSGVTYSWGAGGNDYVACTITIRV